MTDDPGFVTASELRDSEAEQGHGVSAGSESQSDGDAAGPFVIRERPRRRFSGRGGLEYAGGTVFLLTPESDPGVDELCAWVESVLGQADYRWGDWFDLPMPLYLVHDDQTKDTFRVGVRAGRIELHILPETGPTGLAAFYERLGEFTSWGVESVLESER